MDIRRTLWVRGWVSRAGAARLSGLEVEAAHTVCWAVPGLGSCEIQVQGVKCFQSLSVASGQPGL